MFNFKDFTIQVTQQATKKTDPQFEPLEETMIRLNAWIEENDVTVLNVETLLMPNIFDNINSRTSSNGAFEMVESGSFKRNWWYQIFRVWYQ
jgi:hypothetical protein